MYTDIDSGEREISGENLLPIESRKKNSNIHKDQLFKGCFSRAKVIIIMMILPFPHELHLLFY